MLSDKNFDRILKILSHSAVEAYKPMNFSKLKIKRFLSLSLSTSFLLFCTSAHASSGVIHKLLEQVKLNSFSLKAVEQSNFANKLLLDADLFIFSPTAYLNGEYSNQDVVSSSPFAASNSKYKEFTFGASKLWESGIQSDVTYSYLDSSTVYATRDDFFYKSPTLDLTLSTSLLQNLFYNRYQHLLDNQEYSLKSTEISSKIEKKAVIVQSLLDFADLLEQYQELELHQEICRQTRTQSKNLEVKSKRGSVSRREYILGIKELTNCLATVELLQKNMLEDQEAFEATYNVSFDEFKNINTDELFAEAEKLYQGVAPRFLEVDLSEQDDIKSLNLQIKALEAKQNELEAQAKTNLSLEVSTGLGGIGNNFSNSNSDLIDREYPYVYLGLRLDLPLKDRTAVAQAGANRYQLKANQYQKDLLIKQKDFRLKTLEKTLKTDFSIYEKYKKTVSLSQEVIREGRKDFRNGRLDFNTVTEFNKSLVEDQKTLSSYRVALIVRVVEFLDFYQYFDQYL